MRVESELCHQGIDHFKTPFMFDHHPTSPLGSKHNTDLNTRLIFNQHKRTKCDSERTEDPHLYPHPDDK